MTSYYIVGDLVLVHLVPEWLPSGTIESWRVGELDLFWILKKLGEFAYHLKFSTDWGITPIFNVSDLTLYIFPPLELTSYLFGSTLCSYGLGSEFVPRSLSSSVFTGGTLVVDVETCFPLLPNAFPRYPKTTFFRDRILQVEVLSSTRGDVCHYLIRWHDRSASDDFWYLGSEVVLLDVSLLHWCIQTNSSAMSTFERGRIDGDVADTTAIDPRLREFVDWDDRCRKLEDGIDVRRHYIKIYNYKLINYNYIFLIILLF
ncbi:hypothetical protein KSP40_PGU010066 [Platanthera guangdongensis]|uniref:Chromo domain-containing protein n=1 Tax=Platanthera guangdongensis TaxID=2320717 RepID=A0ABR2MQ22_9ASPA